MKIRKLWTKGGGGWFPILISSSKCVECGVLELGLDIGEFGSSLENKGVLNIPHSHYQPYKHTHRYTDKQHTNR